ncbi:ephrin type-B receptor 3-like [Watersipora subatra]|uniref:ephrin type-B receptor 3-like n=1 Tax=Watersipora subatra TaxID=2589382 RepID=UPI00355C90C9
MYKVNDSSYQSSAIFSGLKAMTTYTFMVKATNRAGNSSLANISVITGEAKPVTGPRVEEPTTNGSCVYVSWSPPSSQDANGKIIGYRHRCTNRTAWSETVSTLLEDCGYKAGQSVTCEIQANTTKGFGPSATVSTIIPCTELPKPQFNIASFKNTSASLIIILEVRYVVYLFLAYLISYV